MRTEFVRTVSILTIVILFSACRAADLETTMIAESPTGTPNTTSSVDPTLEPNLLTARAEALLTLAVQQTMTATAPTRTPGPTQPTTPTSTPSATPLISPTPSPGYPPTVTPGPPQGAGGGGMGGGCASGCGGGGGGEPADDTYAGLEAPSQLTPEGPVPTPDMMFFADYGINPFFNTQSDNLSTFSVDVDTGSYTLTRRYLTGGLRPPSEAVRQEEFINYFHQDYPLPTAGEVFNLNLEAAPSPFNAADNYLLRVGVQGYEVAPDQRPDANLVFVVDVSGSMEREDRLEAVKLALYDLVDSLRPSDTVGIIIYSTEAYVLLEPTPVQDSAKIKDAISILHTLESTNVEAGLTLGYRMATDNFDPDRINRIILCSDGVANVSETDPALMLPIVRDKAQDGITLSTVGFGLGNFNDVLMEQLADGGDGQYYYVDSYPEARRIFVDELTATLVTIARDAKIQVEFNPDTVLAYRLIGYENRDIPDAQFRDPSVDAGEINAGHSVTALYEIVPTSLDQQGQIAVARLRWADPNTGDIHELDQTIQVWQRAESFSEASARFQLNAAVVAYADRLGAGAWSQSVTWSAIRSLADTLAVAFADDPDVAEFADLVRRASVLSP